MLFTQQLCILNVNLKLKIKRSLKPTMYIFVVPTQGMQGLNAKLALNLKKYY